MPTGITVDNAWVDILPSMRNFLPLLRAGVAGPAAAAGAEAGRTFGTSFADAVAAASAKVEAAQKRAADATGQLAVAQARLNEVRNAGNASAAKEAAAEEAVAKAQRNVELQTANVARAQEAQARVQTAAAGAAEAAAVKQGRLASGMGAVTGEAGLLSSAINGVNKVYGLMFAAMTVTLPVLPLAAAVNAAGNFQQNLVRLVTTAGEAQQNMSLVGDGMLEMAGKVGIGANDLAKGMYVIESAGFHGADGLKVLQSAAEGARQEQADLATVANAVSTILHDYHLPASEAANVTSQLVAAVARGKVTFEDFTGALHSITPLASAMSIPLSDIAGSLAAMTASGESADQATENMRNALMTLATPSQQMITELSQLGISTLQLSQDLSQRGLAGTMQEISRAILEKMGPAGTVMLDAFNKSQSAAQDLRIMIGSMPADVARLSQGLLDGSVSVRDYRTEVRNMGGQAAAMGLQFLGLYSQADGFNSILRSGKPEVQTYEQALQKAVGTTAGLTVALQLTGENAARTNDTIQAVANAAAQADGHIRGWDEVQGNFNQKVAQATAALGAMGIKIGTVLLPPLGTFFSWITDRAVPGLEHLGRALGDAVQSHGFQDFLSNAGSLIGRLVGDVGRLVAGFVNSGGLHDALTVVGKAAQVALAGLVGLGNIAEHTLGTLVGWFTKLPGPIEAAVVGFTTLRIAAAAGMFDGLLAAGGRLLSFLATLKTGVQLAGLEMAASFRQASAAAAFTASIEGSSAAAARFSGALSGLGAAAGAAARGGLGALKAGLGGLMGLLGGPWGVAIAAATLGIGALVTAVQNHNRAVEQATTDVTDWYKAMASGGQPAMTAADNLRKKQEELAAAQQELSDMQSGMPAQYQQLEGGAQGYSIAIDEQKRRVQELTNELEQGKKAYDDWYNSLSPVEQATARVNAAQTDLQVALQRFGPASGQAAGAAFAYRNALDQQRQVQDQLNEAEKTHLQRLQEIADKELSSVSSALAARQGELQLADAIEQYNQQVATGTSSTSQLEEASNSLAQQALQVAQAAGKAATDQAAANGVTDDGTIAQEAMLQSLRNSAAQITGPGHDALMQMIASLEKSTATTSDFEAEVKRNGSTFQGTWGTNGVVLGHVTDTMIQHLQNMGYTVQHLPNGNITVTANTQPGQDAINRFIAGVQGKTIALFGNFVSRPGVVVANASGNFLTPMPGGSATVVRPNTWRIIGDNMRSDEAYIPIEPNSPRSQRILEQTARAMGHVLVPAAWDPEGATSIGLDIGGIIRPGHAQAPGSFVMPQQQAIPVTVQMKDTVDQAVAWLGSLLGVGTTGPTSGPASYSAALDFARAQVGKPYIWGGVGPGGFDCSGFMSAILNVIRGHNPYSRVGSTANFPWGGAKPAFSTAFTIGSTNNWAGTGVGHMAGNLLGVGVESYGGHGPAVGKVPTGGAGNAHFVSRASYHQGGTTHGWPDEAAALLAPDERVFAASQDDYFQRFVASNEALADRGVPVWHFYLGDREITDLVDTRLEWRDDQLARDLRSAR